jgi:hypothetical protein
LNATASVIPSPRPFWFGSSTPAARSRLLLFPAFFSTRAPLNFVTAFFFFADFFSAMNSPDFVLRLVHAVAPPSRAFT